ncbi:hypothetical protein V2G26_013792 [Clonostachys chloroleuca]
MCWPRCSPEQIECHACTGIEDKAAMMTLEAAISRGPHLDAFALLRVHGEWPCAHDQYNKPSLMLGAQANPVSGHTCEPFPTAFPSIIIKSRFPVLALARFRCPWKRAERLFP